MKKIPWYANGLRFKCTQCGRCCTGAPGYTWVTEDEVVSIANYLKLSIGEFAKKYIRIVGDRFALLERAVTHDCIFLNNKKCEIYPVRPTQCRTYPWWQQNLENEEAWKEAATYCEGIQPDAPVVSYEAIKESLESNKIQIGD